MILLQVTYSLLPGKRDAFYEALNRIGVGEGSRAEAGNLQYEYFFSAEDPDKLMLIERWESQEALDLHKEMPHFKALQPLKAEFLKDTEIKRFDL
ncbi:MAG: antibiotic biosynthesis monooxygenase [Clostridiales bacterium]|nr:antibiotic biosynthesis monooxygenase [Clostridiales bacterium]MBQ3107404.1 antibiotic biosynthesis monooxygenase [Bacillota bacterium]